MTELYYHYVTVPTNDIWVAASAMRHRLALFTFDDHFNNINGLLLYEGAQ